MHPDKAFENFKKISEEFQNIEKLSEADTRCKLIDKILIESLAWEEGYISREDNVESGFVDYILKINSINYLIIEAKKFGITFDIPTNLKGRYFKISGSISKIKPLMEAIKQAQSYCIDLGIKFAIISNGHQFVIFQAFVIGKKWEESNCIIFSSLADIYENFHLFWNLLSRYSIQNGSLINEFEKTKSNLVFKKIIHEMHNPEQKWERNRIYTYLSHIVEFVFTELLDEEKTKVLKQCYVYDRSNHSLGEELDNLFIDKLPHFAENYNVIDLLETENKAGKFERVFRDLRKKEKILPMVVLLGGIGSGKTTFIHRFFKIIMENRESLYWFYLDFRNSSFNPESVEEFVYTQIIDQFQRNYLDKVSDQLNSIGFDLNIENKVDFTKRLFSILKILRITPTVIVDNVDQHDFKFQEKLFIFTNHLCKTLNIVTILAIREETFIQSTRIGVFDAYLISKFHISSPNFIKMVKTRIEFTIELLKHKDKDIADYLDESIRTELIHFFEILLRSFFKDNEQSKRIIHFFDSICPRALPGVPMSAKIVTEFQIT